MAQWDKTLTAAAQVSAEGGIIPRKMQWIKGSSIATAVAYVAAAALIQSPAQELPYAVVQLFKKKKREKRKEKKRARTEL